jgi:hypothetical protein
VKLTQSGADFCGSRFSNADIKLGDIKPKKPAPKQTQPTLTSLDQRGIFISALYWEYCLAPMQEMPKLELASAVLFRRQGRGGTGSRWLPDYLDGLPGIEVDKKKCADIADTAGPSRLREAMTNER